MEESTNIKICDRCGDEVEVTDYDEIVFEKPYKGEICICVSDGKEGYGRKFLCPKCEQELAEFMKRTPFWYDVCRNCKNDG